MKAITSLVLALCATGILAAQNAKTSDRTDAAWRVFWDADGESRALKAAQDIVATGATVEAIQARLRAGRTYGKQATGRVELPTSVAGIALDNALEVPPEYSPDRKWPLRVSLHGGVGREAPGPRDPAPRPLTNRIPSTGELVLHPRAYAQAEWWTREQVDNIARLVERVKHAYNIDESRIYLTGISDGGTGVYFLAMRAATTWAACLPLNGHPLVLANPDTGADGELFSGNLANCPLHIVNGGRDRLYPAASVEPFIDMFKAGGIPLVWQVYPEANHDTSWWPEERAKYEAFLAAHPRQPHPESITWESERTDRYNRFRWLLIDKLGKRTSDVALPDVNTFETGTGYHRSLYDRAHSSGRVDVKRSGNAFDIKSRGVQELTLLLSSEAIDFSKPVQVTVNGKPAHNAIVKPDAATLLKWAARDDDRTMIYEAELRVVVP